MICRLTQTARERTILARPDHLRNTSTLAPLLFVRPGELRKAQWPEIDLEKAEWRISAKRMKMREQHIVPLSRQAVEILRELEPLTPART